MKTLCNYLVLVLLIVAFQSTSILAQESIKNNANLLISSQETITEVPTISVFKQTVFAEVNKTNDISSYTLHYDLVLLKGKNFTFSGNVGFGLLDSPEISDNSEGVQMPKNTDYIVPVEANVWFGNNKHHLEVGLGASLLFGLEETLESFEYISPTGIKVAKHQAAKEYTTLWLTSKIGYRFQQLDKGGLFLRASVSPTFETYSLQNTRNFSVGANIGVGFTFNHKQTNIPVVPYN